MRSRITLLLSCFLCWVAFFSVARLVFLLFFAPAAGSLPFGTLLGTLTHGLRLDFSAAAYLSLLPFVLIVAAVTPPIARGAAAIVAVYTFAWLAALSLLVAADLEIFRNWGRRIDAAVLQYLSHPREIWAAAGGGSPWLLLAILAALLLVFGALFRLVLIRPLRELPRMPGVRVLLLAMAPLLLVIPARGGFQQIPINQSAAYFSSEPFANQAALNAGWNFIDTWKRGLDRKRNPYAILPADSARALARNACCLPVPLDEPRPPAAAPGTPPVNLLLILWEGFTARAVERLGGLPGITPEFDALRGEGLLFTRFYAAGDRTEKGLAALLSSAPTVPTASVLTVPAKSRTLPMLSRDLRTAGYATGFYYGGELGFANIGSYLVEGGFDRIVGEQDFPRALRTSKWGVHDEPVADRVLADLEGMREPFFTTWLTLSSHEPFDVPPPVRIPGSDGESRFLNSLAYTDHVIGELLRRAASRPWWKHTLVVIVADHSKKLERTDAQVPYKSAAAWYHVPMLWTGGALARRGEYPGLASQTDLAPTLLAQLGLPGGERYRFGVDLFGPTRRAFAAYAFDDGFGLVTGSGSLVWEHAPDRMTSSTGTVTERDLTLGKALLQLMYQDYLDR